MTAVGDADDRDAEGLRHALLFGGAHHRVGGAVHHDGGDAAGGEGPMSTLKEAP